MNTFIRQTTEQTKSKKSYEHNEKAQKKTYNTI